MLTDFSPNLYLLKPLSFIEWTASCLVLIRPLDHRVPLASVHQYLYPPDTMVRWAIADVGT